MSNVSQVSFSPLQTLDQWFTFEELNQALGTLRGNIEKIGNLIDTTRIGQACWAFDAVTEPDVQEGQPVWFNATTQRFERSQLSLLVSGSGRVYASNSSEAWGLVTKKCTATRAHVLLTGLADVSLEASTGTATPSGKFYLSRQLGLLANTPDHSLVVPVLLATGSGQVLFRPWFADTFPRYTPSFVDLAVVPAGQAGLTAGRVVIQDADPEIPGWLPASHDLFDDQAPAGAKFGYNISQDLALVDSWPPLIPENSKLYLEPGGTLASGARVLLNDQSRVLINQQGIWWMNDCPGQQPWSYGPEGLTTGTCPAPQARRLTLETDLTLWGDELQTAVTTLGSLVPWLKVRRLNSILQATTGDLQLAVDDTQLYDSGVPTGNLAFREVVGGRFRRGPVVTGLRSISSSLVLSGGTVTEGVRSGDIDVSFSASRDQDLLPVDTQLLGATMESYGDLMAIGLPAGYRTSFVNSYHIPSSLSVESEIKFHFWLAGQQTILLPSGLLCLVRVFPTPASGQPALVPAEVELTLDYQAGQSILSGQYRAVETEGLMVQAGNTVYLKIIRAGDQDGVAQELHVLKQFGRFEV